MCPLFGGSTVYLSTDTMVFLLLAFEILLYGSPNDAESSSMESTIVTFSLMLCSVDVKEIARSPPAFFIPHSSLNNTIYYACTAKKIYFAYSIYRIISNIGATLI